MFGKRLAPFVRLCVCACALAAWIAPVRAQALADVARKEEERRKTVAQPGKTYTNKDLRPVTVARTAAFALVCAEGRRQGNAREER